MKVVALVSGGKDSCYSMMKCTAYGHEIVALANLHPPSHVGEELDSWMYQTVGHAHVKHIAEAMNLPFYRRQIQGQAVEQGLRYTPGATAGDEVEDLHALLCEVLEAHPDVGGVCSGAILSNYQRSRVESVCARLGLASLAYLWQREQPPLLDEMIGAGVHAVVVKVASLGLTANHLGRSLGELRPHFAKLEERGFGFHVCGEGGEYETFTLDCPLFRRRLQPTGASKVVAHGGGAALLSWEALELVDKEAAGDEAGAEHEPTPKEAEAELEREMDDEAAEQSKEEEEEEQAAAAAAEEVEVAAPGWIISLPIEDGGCKADAAGPAAPCVRAVDIGGGLLQLAVEGGGGSAAASGPVASAADQMTCALEALQAGLVAHGLSLSHVLLLRLYVASMAEYKLVNAAFSRVLGESVPAARVAVELPLCAGSQVAVECVAWAGAKALLHVQSISEWAPRMIGPYAQLTTGLGTASVAGCIALVPAAMGLIAGGATREARLALRHCAAVLRGLDLTTEGARSLIIYIVDAADAFAVRRVALRWLRRHASPAGGDGAGGGGGEAGASARRPPLLLLQVGALPMGAKVEAQLEVTSPSGAPLRCREAFALPLASEGGGGGKGGSGGGGPSGEVQVNLVVGPLAAAPGEPGVPASEGGAVRAPQGQTAASGVAFCTICVAEADTWVRLSPAQVGTSIGDVVTRIAEHLRASGLTLGPGVYARLFFDEGAAVTSAASTPTSTSTGAPSASAAAPSSPSGVAQALCESVRRAVANAGLRTCEAFALPVVRVLGPAASRLAVQLHFTAREAPAKNAATGTAADVSDP